ncbi:interleukin-27 subunit beta [Sesbania bispinosa]|nr:interleukin-27 subunit beta [Sesbania bispinosa]
MHPMKPPKLPRSSLLRALPLPNRDNSWTPPSPEAAAATASISLAIIVVALPEASLTVVEPESTSLPIAAQQVFAAFQNRLCYEASSGT